VFAFPFEDSFKIVAIIEKRQNCREGWNFPGCTLEDGEVSTRNEKVKGDDGCIEARSIEESKARV